MLFLTLALTVALQAAEAPPLPWTPNLKADPATKLQTGSASATSNEGNGRLVVRCDRTDDIVVSIQFIPTPPFAKASPRPVSLSFDNGPALGANWEFPGKGAVMTDEIIVTNLSLGIAHARQIKVHAIDPANQVLDATFAGPASEAPIKQVVEACGYTLGVVPHAPAPAPAPAPEESPAP